MSYDPDKTTRLIRETDSAGCGATLAEITLANQLQACADELARVSQDKARLDWLDAYTEQGVNTLAHESPQRRGHVYRDKRWVELDGGGQRAEWDHFYGPTVRAAIDAARAVPVVLGKTREELDKGYAAFQRDLGRQESGS